MALRREAQRGVSGGIPAAAAPVVADLMRRDFVALPPETSLAEARRTMQLARLRHLCVVGEREALLGIVSYRDLVDAFLARLEASAAPASLAALGAPELRTAMRPAPYVARPQTPAAEAARRMLSLHLGCLPVCERVRGAPRLVGLLSESDLLRAAWLG